MTAAGQQELAELLSACGAPAGAADQGSAIFEQPWHAEVFATTLSLSRNGLFSWSEWVEFFSARIADAPQLPDEDAGAAYYRQWLAALEAILDRKKIIEPERISEAKEDWRRSYLHTEHGKPVVFRRGLPEPPHHHDEDHHHHHHQAHVAAMPISVSPAKPR